MSASRFLTSVFAIAVCISPLAKEYSPPLPNRNIPEDIIKALHQENLETFLKDSTNQHMPLDEYKRKYPPEQVEQLLRKLSDREFTEENLQAIENLLAPSSEVTAYIQSVAYKMYRTIPPLYASCSVYSARNEDREKLISTCVNMDPGNRKIIASPMLGDTKGNEEYAGFFWILGQHEQVTLPTIGDLNTPNIQDMVYFLCTPLEEFWLSKIIQKQEIFWSKISPEKKGDTALVHKTSPTLFRLKPQQATLPTPQA